VEAAANDGGVAAEVQTPPTSFLFFQPVTKEKDNE